MIQMQVKSKHILEAENINKNLKVIMKFVQKLRSKVADRKRQKERQLNEFKGGMRKRSLIEKQDMNEDE